MKCTCGAEIPGGARFCGKCGKTVAAPGQYCHNCGSLMYPGARFCGKCGTSSVPVIPEVSAGRSAAAPAKSLRDAAGDKVRTLRDKTRPVRDWAEHRIVDRDRAKKILMIALVIGLCFLTAGFSGKICMGRVTESIRNTSLVSGLGSDLDSLLNRSAQKEMTKLLIAMIRNDPSGFMKTVNQLMSAAGSMAGDPYGMNGLVTMFISPIAEEAFADTRNQLIQEAGMYWPLLQAMAYYRELLTVGAIVAAAAAVLLFLMGGELRDIKKLRMQPAFFAGAGWAGLMAVFTVIGNMAIRNMMI